MDSSPYVAIAISAAYLPRVAFYLPKKQRGTHLPSDNGGAFMQRIKIAIVGVGNCASSLVQGIHYYRDKEADQAIGLMHWDIGGYKPGDLEVVAAFDIDKRKVGLDINRAIFEKPNCTTVFCSDLADSGVKVSMGAVLDGYSDHMKNHPEHRSFVLADNAPATKDDVVRILRDSDTEVLLNYLPVGSEEATRFYAECALEAGVAFVNNIPVFIASDQEWAKRFEERNLPLIGALGKQVRECPMGNGGAQLRLDIIADKRFEERNLPLIGDDIKAQLGATITHRTLTDLFAKRGVKLDRTYQLNTGGNTDFLNMLNRERLESKKISKTEAVQSVAENRLDEDNIHVGPSDYVPWQKDNKICFLRMEGRLFGDVPMNLELRLSVEDSPNSAGVAIDMVRCAKLALKRGEGGVLDAPSAYFCKHPREQMTDDVAHNRVEAFIAATSTPGQAA